MQSIKGGHMTTEPTVLTASTDLATETTAELFSGSDHDVDVSFFINHARPGSVTAEHRHPYPEVFVIRDGEATFVVDEKSLTAHSGQVFVVPARATHGFRSTGSDVLEMLSIHPVPEMVTEWVQRP
jgi:mannose-6-phosphate isomerase-like protein (cupin superfamily)